MLLVLLVACVGKGEDSAEMHVETQPGIFAASLAPQQLAFGSIAVLSERTIDLAVQNDGETTISVTYANSQAEGITLGLPPTDIAPGQSATLPVTWVPQERGHMAGTLDLLIGDGNDVREFNLPVAGDATGPSVAVSDPTVDLGMTEVGCSSTAVIRVSDAGESPLTITSMAFLDGAPLTLTDLSGGPFSYPLTLKPGASLDVQMQWAPAAPGRVDALLRVASDDPTNPDLDVPVAGTADYGGEGSVSYVSEGAQAVTALLAVNACMVSMGYAWPEPFDAEIPTFFQTLLDSGAHWRLAFLHTNTGVVDYEVPYIDDSYSVDDASAMARAMIENATGDNDSLFQTLDNGIGENIEWLVEEDHRWEDSRLHLVGFNRDVEQSSGNYVTWLNQFNTYKDDTTQVVVHGVGGDVPRGCSSAEPAQAFYDAAAATGGTFQSICADYHTTMSTLAEAIAGAPPPFVLDGLPATWSIEVFVDGEPERVGWVYDDESNAVRFDVDHYPVEGSDVRVDYYYAPDCSDGS